MPEESNLSDSQEEPRMFPRFDIVAVQSGNHSYSAFLIDHDTGETWVFGEDRRWQPILKSSSPASDFAQTSSSQWEED